MRLIKKSTQKIIVPPTQPSKDNIVKNKTITSNTIQDNKVKEKIITSPAPTPSLDKSELKKKITFAGDKILWEQVQATLREKHLAGDYQYPNFSAVIRQALVAYQTGMKLTVDRNPTNPKKDITFRLMADLVNFYDSLAPFAKTSILERALASYYQQYLVKD